MPTGKVKWYDADKGFGFIASDEGGDVFVRQAALPSGVTALKGGQRVEFGVAQGKRGDQALNVRVLDPLPSVVAAKRRPPDELHGMIEDMIKVLEAVGEFRSVEVDPRGFRSGAMNELLSDPARYR